MDKKVLFNNALASLVEFAAGKNNEITSDDVKLHFKDLIEDESQFRFTYDYLAVNKIKVEGFEPDADESILGGFKSGTDESVYGDFPDVSDSKAASDSIESQEELAFIQMYMQDISKITPANDEEKASLIDSLLKGNLSVVERLVESHLTLAAEIAEKYRGKGVTFGDLIQEGNMGLMLGISEYNAASGDFDEFITAKITDAIETTVNSQISSDRIGQHLADKLNQLDIVTKNLSEKLERVPDISELAEAMSISEEEVSLLLKTSLDTLSVNEDAPTASGHVPVENDDLYTVPEEDPLQWRINKK